MKFLVYILLTALTLNNWQVKAGLKDLLPKNGPVKLTSYSIGSALRYLSKAVLSDALLSGDSTTTQDDLQSSSLQDSSDCVKRLICELRGKSKRTALDWDEALIMKSIPAKIDYASPIIQFQLAADLGKKRPDQCQVVYSRCSFDAAEVMGLMRQRGTSLDIPTNDEYGCTVLFLWNQKYDGIAKDQDQQQDDS